MKKLFFFLILLLFFPFATKEEKNLTFGLINKGEPIYFFWESVGTSPAFGGLTEYVQLPEESVKIIGWHRVFPKDINWKEKNTYWLDLPRKELNYAEKNEVFFKNLKILREQYPDNPVIIYTGIYELKYINNYMKKNLQHNIAHIYLWEDGFFNILENLVILPQKIKSSDCLVPITFYVAGYDKLTAEEKNMLAGPNMCPNLKVVDFDVREVGDKLTEKQKKIFFDMIGFDYEKFKFLKNKKLYLFTTGHVHLDVKSSWKQTPTGLLKILSKARSGGYGNIPENVVWGFKLHPALEIYDLAPDIIKEHPDMIEIPAFVPFETLLLAGIIPEKIIGTGSSFVFWLNSSQILKYISHPLYDEALEKYGIIAKKDMIYPHIPDVKNVKMKLEKGGIVPEYWENGYCLQNDLYQCMQLEKIEQDCLKIYWDKGLIEKKCLKNGIYR